VPGETAPGYVFRCRTRGRKCSLATTGVAAGNRLRDTTPSPESAQSDRVVAVAASVAALLFAGARLPRPVPSRTTGRRMPPCTRP
jgi:hypothetical protein